MNDGYERKNETSFSAIQVSGAWTWAFGGQPPNVYKWDLEREKSSLSNCELKE